MTARKFYRGKRFGPRQTIPEMLVEVVTIENESKSVARTLRHVVRHSPNGFEWGYGGSGPADLARCILVDHFGGREPLADMFYQTFKFDYVASWGDQWEVSGDEIDRWIRQNIAKTTDEMVEVFDQLPKEERRWSYLEDAIRGRGRSE